VVVSTKTLLIHCPVFREQATYIYGITGNHEFEKRYYLEALEINPLDFMANKNL
jgi:hypothetical protein